MRDLYVVALVLLAGLAGTVARSPESSKDNKKTTVPIEAKAAGPRGPLAVICDTASDAECSRDHIRPELTAPNGLNVIIAFVPDPERTSLRLNFDREIESLQNAAQDEGYRFIDYWMPWSATAGPDFTTRPDREAERQNRAQKSSFPGVLVFQSVPPKPPLVLFLVGDRPSGGYSREELKNALAYEDLLRTDGTPLEILGPDFSGSLALLGQGLATVPRERTIFVRSGSATNGRGLNDLNSQLWWRGPDSSATSYLACDDETTASLARFLTGRLGAKSPFSMLLETRTVFGQSFGSQSDDSLCGTVRVDSKLFAHFSFPPGLSYVRKAYGKTLTPTNPDLPDVSSDRPSLQLDLSYGEQTQDQQPEFSASTPVSHDAELGATAEALQHDRIRFASIVATDPLDTLFVASYLRSALPDARLIFMDSDILDALPSNDVSLEGSLLVSSYPVFFEAQGWHKKRDADARPVFSSQFEEGIYNAARTLISHGALAPHALEPTRIWISVIGRDGLWPVSVEPDPNDPEPLGWSYPPRVWVALTAALLFGLGTFLAAFFLAKGDRPPQWCADFSLYETRGNLAARGSYITGTCVAAVGCWLAATGGQVGAFMEAPQNYWIGGTLVLFVAALFLAVAIGISVWTLRQFRPAPGPRLAANQSGAFGTYFVIPWLVLITYLWALWMTIRPGLYKEGYFFSLRSIEIGSGVSPSLPFLFICAAFVLFCVTQLKRVVFADERFQRVPSIETEPLEGVLVPRLKDLNELVAAPLLDQPWNVRLACLVAPVSAYLFAWYSLRSFEGWWFDQAFAIFVAILCLGLVLTVARFWFCWSSLLRVLEALELHPFREAFASIPKDAAWASVWQQTSGKRSYTLFSRTLECLKSLKDEPQFAGVDYARIERLSNELIQSVSSGVRERIQVYWNLQRELYVAGCAATAALEGKTAKDAEAPNSKCDIEKFVAMRYAAMFRYIMAQLRNMATFLTFGFVLLTLSLGSYPFLAPQGIAWFLSIVLIGLSVPVVTVFHQMSNDPILKRMTVANEGKTDWGFITRTLSFTALPVLTVMASHFPIIGKYVLSWVQPALKSIN